MKDRELRGLVLQKYADHRRDGFVSLKPDDFGQAISQDDILYASGQLHEDGLIDWIFIRGHNGKVANGRGQIKLEGIKIVDGEVSTPPNISFDYSTNITVTNSPSAQVGNNNVQANSTEFVKAVEGMISAIQNSPVPDAEKKSLITKLADFVFLPATAAIIGETGAAYLKAKLGLQ